MDTSTDADPSRRRAKNARLLRTRVVVDATTVKNGTFLNRNDYFPD
jgi:hypothetical protein